MEEYIENKDFLRWEYIYVDKALLGFLTNEYLMKILNPIILLYHHPPCITRHAGRSSDRSCKF